VGILSRLESERRQSPENPSTNLANPEAWLVDALASGPPTRTGKRVNETTALYNTALSACVRLLSETVATLPLHVIRQQNGRREVDNAHPVAQLLRRPNAEMDPVQFRETLMAHVLTWGNAYAEIEYNGAGVPVRLWPLLPDRTAPYRSNGGILFYSTTIQGKTYQLPAENVFHLTGLGFDGIVGYSPVRMHREALGLALATEEFGASWFGSGSRPSGVLSHPGVLSEGAKKNLKASWNSEHSGLSNANRVAILEEGLKWQQIGIPPEDAQFLETRKFQVEEVARMYRVPLHLIQHMEKSTSWGTGIEELGQGFVTYSLQTWLVRWEQRIQSRLIPARDQGTYYVKHSVEGLLRGDSIKRAEYYSKMWNLGAFSINDILALEDKNPIEGGDARFIPLNVQPLDMALNPADPAPIPQEPRAESRILDPTKEERSIARRSARRDVFRPLFRGAGQRLVSWENARLKAAIKRGRAANNADSVGDWIGDQEDATKAYAAKQFGPVVKSYSKDIFTQLAEEEKPTAIEGEEFNNFVQQYTEGLAARYNNESLAGVRGVIANAPNVDAAFDALDDLVDQWDESRADNFSEQELAQSAGAFTRMAYGLLGVMVLRWKANVGACPLCMELNGAVTEITKPFVQKGSTVDPGDTAPLVTVRKIQHPPLHLGCGCEIVPG